jgi:NADH dehydrogenase
MAKRILIAGAGFAGVWSALGAARVREQAGRDDGSIEIAVVAPEPWLNLRPRFHESELAQMRTPLLPLFDAVGVRYVEGTVKEKPSGR